MRRLVHLSLAQTTRSNYQTGVRHFKAFCGKNNLSPFPATKLSVTHLAAFLSLKALAPSTIKVYLAAVGAWHREQGFRDPCHRNPLLLLVKRGATVAYTTPPPCRAPITVQILRCLIRVTHRDRHLAQQNRIMLVAAFCTAFHGFLQVSDIYVTIICIFSPFQTNFLERPPHKHPNRDSVFLHLLSRA